MREHIAVIVGRATSLRSFLLGGFGLEGALELLPESRVCGVQRQGGLILADGLLIFTAVQELVAPLLQGRDFLLLRGELPSGGDFRLRPGFFRWIRGSDRTGRVTLR